MLSRIRRWLRRSLRMNSAVMHLKPYVDPRATRNNLGRSLPPARSDRYWQAEFEKRLACNPTEIARRNAAAREREIGPWMDDAPHFFALQAD